MLNNLKNNYDVIYRDNNNISHELIIQGNNTTEVLQILLNMDIEKQQVLYLRKQIKYKSKGYCSS